MDDQIPNDRLSVQAPDYVVSAAKALGAVPFAGSLLSEIAGAIIPNQRVERIVGFARQLESRLSEVDQRFVRREIDKATLQDSYDEHLAQVGLPSARHNVDSRTNQLVGDRFTGALEVRGYEITSLGRLLLKQVGAEVEVMRANIALDQTVDRDTSAAGQRERSTDERPQQRVERAAR